MQIRLGYQRVVYSVLSISTAAGNIGCTPMWARGI
jgi:hypothetical protein